MTIADRIQKLGFRRWYERTLIESHAYLITSFLGMILTFSGLEVFGRRADAASAVGVTFGLIAGLAGVVLVVFGSQRYFRTLTLAGTLGDRATCAQCSAYGVFNVLASGSTGAGKPDDAGAGAPVWLKVKCRKCGHAWDM